MRIDNFQVDNAYWVWSFQGRLIRKHSLDRFCQLLWRPRPPSLLSEEKIKEIKKNLSKYSTQFEHKDRVALSKVSKEQLEKRRKMLSDFQSYRKKNEQLYNSNRNKRDQLRNEGKDIMESNDYEEETIEFFVKEEVFLEDNPSRAGLQLKYAGLH